MNNKKSIKQEITHIKQTYLQHASCKTIGGHHPLSELSQKIWKIINDSPKKYVVPLFILSEIFSNIAEDQYEREVTLDECEKLYEKLHNFILKTITDIEKNAKENALLTDCTNLVKAYINAMQNE
ncbi:MAG: hypothetical protein ACUVXA_16695 [Candidatus Jordarchaeum sp.]|uniref:hypothetical protein n=1 Tax=Candidatus Jordarchaeum sp. TaxID=2823881 RepID=UPI00404AC66E